jgi:S-adenosylmethionine:tRNA ribosyltransferase-isomerase
MTDPKHISIAAFDYDLPENRIAFFPMEKRDSSRLLVWQHHSITEKAFGEIISCLPPDSLIIFNDTRVLEARIIFHKPTGGRIEIFCLEPGDIYPDITTALSRYGAVTWKCLIGNAASWTPGLVLEKIITFRDTSLTLLAKLVKREPNHFEIDFSWSPENVSFAEVLHHAGQIPLPPYIKRQAETSDAERYQTIYAHLSGSVAAPTAGLHFTDAIINSLHEKNIKKDFITLHVGAGTFKPVKSETMGNHEMHSECIEIPLALVQKIYDNLGRDIIAVGTTSLRTLESLYWLGRKLYLDLPGELQVNQWDPYNDNEKVSVRESLQALIQSIVLSGNNTLMTKTNLLIVPGYEFKLVNVLITNFHQPRSTLLLLVSAFIGENWKGIYAYALKKNFRFLSYGDACLLFRQ